jgi:hypothetical protein
MSDALHARALVYVPYKNDGQGAVPIAENSLYSKDGLLYCCNWHLVSLQNNGHNRQVKKRQAQNSYLSEQVALEQVKERSDPDHS